MVDAVNNNSNRNTVLTTAGAGVGLAAGAGYGAWLSKPLLDGDAPSDAFVRRFYDNDAKSGIAKAAEDAKKALTDSKAYKDADDVAKLTNLVKDKASDFGLKAEFDADGNVTKSLDDVVKEFIGKETDAAKIKAKMEKSVSDTASKAATEAAKDSKKLAAIAKDAKALADDANAETLKAFVTKHAETLGIKADDIETTSKKSVADIKKLAEDAAKPLAKAKNTILDNFDVKDGLKALKEGATDNEKSIYEAVKKAARDTKLWAGAKWAAGAGAVLGLATYIGAKMTAPKAEATQDEQA